MTFPNVFNLAGINQCCALIQWQNFLRAKRNLDALTEDKKTVLAHSVVRATNDLMSQNGKVKFEDDVEKEIEQIDAEPENFKHSKPL